MTFRKTKSKTLVQEAARIRAKYPNDSRRSLAFAKHLLASDTVGWEFDREGARRVSSLAMKALGRSKPDVGRCLRILREEKAGISKPWCRRLLEDGLLKTSMSVLKIPAEERRANRTIRSLEWAIDTARKIGRDETLPTVDQKALALVESYVQGGLLDPSRKVISYLRILQRTARHAGVKAAVFSAAWVAFRAVKTGYMPESALESIRTGVLAATTVVRNSGGYGSKVTKRRRRNKQHRPEPVAINDISFAEAFHSDDFTPTEASDDDLAGGFDRIVTVFCNDLNELAMAAARAKDGVVAALANKCRDLNGPFKMQAAQLVRRRVQTTRRK
jgi:hypothetical protein